VAFTLVAMLAMIGQTVNGQGPQKISYGQTVNGEVSDPEAQADYVFQGQKGDSIIVAVVRQATWNPRLQSMGRRERSA
jgi:hypothetical protein